MLGIRYGMILVNGECLFTVYHKAKHEGTSVKVMGWQVQNKQHIVKSAALLILKVYVNLRKQLDEFMEKEYSKANNMKK